MNFILLQGVLLFFALFMIYVLYIHRKKGHVTTPFFIIWFLLWLAFIFVDIFPGTIRFFLSEFYIVRILDLGMIFAFMVLTYVTIENNINIKNLNTKIEKLVRDLAKEKYVKK